MREVPPCVLSDFSSFTSPQSIEPNEDPPETICGSISQDGTWCWIGQDSSLMVYSVQTKECCSMYSFSSQGFVITAIEELSSNHLPFPCLLIGLEAMSNAGLLCLFNVKTSKVINAIQLPFRVTSLEVVSNVGGAVTDTLVLHEQLRCLFGIVAVGSEGGNVLLVDLCLDTENYSNESMPNKVFMVGKSYKNLPQRREVAISKKQHLCMFLNDNNHECDTFEYRNHQSVLATFPSNEVIVSCMKYVRNLACVIVGFNFGGIQMWNLHTLILEITIPIHTNQQPLVQFAFQEPENDPRNYCYLWAIRGHHQGENFRPENSTEAALYSLSYAKREHVPHFGVFYQNLQACSKKFEYTFTSDPYNPAHYFNSSTCSRLISCRAISHAEMSRTSNDSLVQNEEWSTTGDLGLCLFAWENWTANGEKPVSSYLALFDINQYYREQMPTVLRCKNTDMCSYFGVFSLKEVSRNMNFESLLAANVVPNSISRFKSTSMADETFFPSSSSFKIWCLSKNGILQATYLGAQRQLLADMNSKGPTILVDPKELYNLCLMNGLLNQLNFASPGKLTVTRQRETLLSLALEHSMIRFLTDCVQSWKKNEFFHVGCTSKFLLDWVWKKVTQIKTTIDELCQPLFNCSGQGLDEKSLLTLHIFKNRLKYLSDIISLFQTLPQTELGQQELQLRKRVVDSISTYLHVLMWLYECKLLPEHSEEDEPGEDNVSYPATLLNRTYSYRRTELRRIHSSIQETDILMIDGLVEMFGESLISMWSSKGGLTNYPPPSIYAAVSSYLIDGISITQKHMLMYYLLLDVIAYLNEHKPHLLDKLNFFCATNNINSSVSKLTQAFWHLDHQAFESAISLLLDPGILPSEFLPWQHQRIIKALLYQGQPHMALKYVTMRMPPEDTADAVKLHLSVLLANGLIGDAFYYLRQRENDSNIEDLLTHTFLGCQQTHNLDAFLQLPLNIFESYSLSKYLHSCGDPKAVELLVISHLLKSQPLEASNLNEKLVNQMMERGVKAKDRAACRNALITGFVGTLPEEQLKLSQELNQVYAHVEKREVDPHPLSSNVTSKALSCISYSDFLRNIMDNYNEPASQRFAGPQTPFRSWKPDISTTPFLCPSITPERRKRKRISELFSAQHFGKSTSNFECNGFSTPIAKRSRTFDIRSFRLNDNEVQNSRTVESPLNKSLLSLLCTPDVPRTASRQKSPASQMRPLSILKTRPSIAVQETNVEQFSPVSRESLCATTPSVCSEMSKDEEMSEVEVLHGKIADVIQPRHLRFQVPSLNDSVMKSPEKEVAQSSSSQISPRKPLHITPYGIKTVFPLMSQNQDIIIDDDTETDMEVICDSSPRKIDKYDISKYAPLQSHIVSQHELIEIESHSAETKDSSDASSSDIMFIGEVKGTYDVAETCPTESENEWTLQISDSENSQDGRNFQDIQGVCHRDAASNFMPESVGLTSQTLKRFFSTHEGNDVDDITLPEADLPPTSYIASKEELFSATTYPVSQSSSSSKSASPLSSPKTVIPEKSIKPVSLFTQLQCEKEIIKIVSDPGSIIPIIEVELPQPVLVTSEKRKVLEPINTVPMSEPELPPPLRTPEKKQVSDLRDSPYRHTRSRSRSQSSSPSTSSTKKSEISPLSTPKFDFVLTSKSFHEQPIVACDEEKTPQLSEKKEFEGLCEPSIKVSPNKAEVLKSELLHVDEIESDPPFDILLGAEAETQKTPDRNKGDDTKQSRAQSTPTGSYSPSRQQSLDSEMQQISPEVSNDKPQSVLHSHEMKGGIQEVDNPLPEIKTKSVLLKRTVKPRRKIVRKTKKEFTSKIPDLEFSFSNPSVPANSKIISTLTSTESVPVSAFVFSPPTTTNRTRNRRRVNETLNPTSAANPPPFQEEQQQNKADDDGMKVESAAEFPEFQFSFSKPNVSATSAEIIAALSSAENVPVASFVFSPPAYRTRYRQRMNDTLNSTCTSSVMDESFMSTGFPSSHKDVQAESGMKPPQQPVKKLKSSSKTKSKSKVAKSAKGMVNLISPIGTPERTDTSEKSLASAKHTMVLRKAKKTVRLF